MMDYPDFTQQIIQLKMLLKDSDDEQKIKLVGKWISSLEEINNQIVHLKKIEKFAEKVKKD